MSKRGFTLLEVLIAASIFAIVGVLATTIFTNLNRDKQRITSRSLLYDDAQFILDELSRKIISNTIDYEEYHNQLVLQGKPGMNFGRYAAKFYYNLKNGTADCVDQLKDDNKKSCVNTGKNPSSGGLPDNANAFYASGVAPMGDSANIFCKGFLPFHTSTKYHACVKQLFLIDGSANQKTLIARERIDWGSASKPQESFILAQISMIHPETSDKKITFQKLYTCKTSSCSNKKSVDPSQFINMPSKPSASIELLIPDVKDLEATSEIPKGATIPDQNLIAKAYEKDFIPFTPSRINVKDISFYITPVEDPNKAFAEANENVGMKTNIHQPKVTIVLTVEPISNVRYGTKHPLVTVQTTVSPGTFSEVLSYPPQMK